MRLRTAVLVTVAVLLPLSARAQGTTAPAVAPVALTQTTVNKTLPLVKVELTNPAALAAKLAAAGMSKATYTANRNAIVVALLDGADTTRLVRKPVFVQVRKINMEIMHAIKDGLPNFDGDFGGLTSGDTVEGWAAANCGILCAHF